MPLVVCRMPYAVCRKPYALAFRESPEKVLRKSWESRWKFLGKSREFSEKVLRKF